MLASKYLASAAEFSPCKLFRYSLTRRLSLGDRAILFCGLNPSTATAEQDDPTIRREVDYARSWGFDVYYKVNVYGYRSTDPKVLPTIIDPVGPMNDATVRELSARAELVVAAWGRNKLNAGARRIATFVLDLPHARCLGVNQDGTPKHPLYLKKTTALIRIP